MRVRNTDLNIRIGTSGFSYEDWVGTVYPKGTKKSDMLSYYARDLGFDVVELNYTYYTMPSAKSVEGLLKSVPEDFEFVVKVSGSLTHRIRGADGAFLRDEGAVETFLGGLRPMIESGRLKCVLAQFPMKFRRDENSMAHLRWLAEAMRSVRLAVEFRNSGWVAQSVFNTLRELGAAYCVVDEPDLPGLSPFTPVVTSPLAYFRFHGRNRRWFNVPSTVRYDYRYTDEELRRFLPPIRKLAAEAEQTLIFFNNHFQGSAVSNAMKLRELLETA
ncbi:MAG: DUF72 domain-containing protein [Candidatus Nitrospinota bacterium M3_3B_026]